MGARHISEPDISFPMAFASLLEHVSRGERVRSYPHIRDGGRARTSLLLQVQPGLRWARTWNRYYRLGSHSRMTFFEWQYERKISPRMQIVEFDAKDRKA